jgi:hypothetical protein
VNQIAGSTPQPPRAALHHPLYSAAHLFLLLCWLVNHSCVLPHHQLICSRLVECSTNAH